MSDATSPMAVGDDGFAEDGAGTVLATLTSGDGWHRHEVALPEGGLTMVAHAHDDADAEHGHDDIVLGEPGEVKGPDVGVWGDRPPVGDDGQPIVPPTYEVKGPDPAEHPDRVVDQAAAYSPDSVEIVAGDVGSVSDVLSSEAAPPAEG